MRVLLVDMPFDNLERPALGLSLLKARLLEDGVECGILYANAILAAAISVEAYTTIADESPTRSLAGEWVFREDVFGPDPATDEDFVRQVLAGMPQEYVACLRHARAAVPAFLDGLLSSVAWGDVDVVGFTSSGDQNLAAMGLARRLKERRPHLVIVAGGPNWHGPMGVTQLEVFPFVDIAFLGEGEDALPAVVGALARGEDPAGVPGVAVRNAAGQADHGAAFVPDLDAVPTPDFGDYFEAMSVWGLDGEVECGICLEASRGCGWAAHRPCSFCGLSGPVRSYRQKEPARVLKELREASLRWPGRDIDLVDNMVPPRFLTEVLPELARAPLGGRLFFEARADLSREDVETIAAAGARLQVGIESLSDHVLRLMGKGLTVRRVLRLLDDCRECRIDPAWNILLGVPGETDDDYREMIELVPSLRHLSAPQVCAPLTLVRFSPLFESHATLGYRNVRPSRAYRLMYPVAERLLWGLASAFDHDEDLPLRTRAYRYRLRAEVRRWQASGSPAPHGARARASASHAAAAPLPGQGVLPPA